MKYHLEKYKGKATRHTCPKCGDKNCFTLYVDEKGKSVHSSVGRCDHEQSCGYDYTPRQFFHDNPWEREGYNGLRGETRKRTFDKPIQRKRVEPTYLPMSLVRSYADNTDNDFMRWVRSKIADTEAIARTCKDYYIGTTKNYGNQAVIFWQIDRCGEVHDGKLMWYKPDGHRQKWMSWVSAKLKEVGRFPDADTVKCLYGEHLLETYEDKTVCLVESEKSAIVCSCLYPTFLWLATAGCGGLNVEKARALRGRNVIVLPDAGEYDKWKVVMEQTGNIDYRMADFAERYAKNTDLVDILIDKIAPLSGEPADVTEEINKLNNQFKQL